MPDDEEWEELHTRASREADRMVMDAASLGLGSDFCISWCRINEQRAVELGRGAMQKYWSTVGSIIHRRQWERDDSMCRALEQIERLDELRPDDGPEF